MAHEKHLTPKQVAFAVLEKVGEMLKKSEPLQKKYEGFKAVEESARKSGASDPGAVAAAIGRKKYGKEAFQEAAAKGRKMGKSERIRELQKSGMSPNQIEVQLAKDESDGHYSMAAAPEHPEAGKHPAGGKTAVDSKCPEPPHPSPENGEGDPLRRTKAQEDWQDGNIGKSELSVDLEGLEILLKGETENSKKLGYKLSDEGKEEVQPEKSDNAFKVEPKDHKSSDDQREGHTPDPDKNPKEEAEGNNELAGTTPTQVGQDGKNKPGGDEIKGHLKLAKFVGRMEYRRTAKQNQAKVASQEHVGNAQAESSAQHTESIKGK